MEPKISNGFLKIENPQLRQGTTLNYVGNINEFDFANIVPSQYKNFCKLRTLLNLSNIEFEEINIVKWNSQLNHSSPGRCKFIVKTTHPNLLWYKYDTEAPGGGNNFIYYKKRKIKTTIFTNYNVGDLDELLIQDNGVNGEN